MRYTLVFVDTESFGQTYDHKVFAAAEPTGVVADFIVAKPKHHFMASVVSGLCLYNGWYGLPYLTVMLSTGPWYLSLRLRSFQYSSNDTIRTFDRIHILPKRRYNGEILRHIAGSSWQGWDGLFIWWIFGRLSALCKFVGFYISNLCVFMYRCFAVHIIVVAYNEKIVNVFP